MQASSSAAQDAQLVTAAFSKALAANVEYEAPEALGGEARMRASDAFSMGAVLAAAASDAAPQSGPSAQWDSPEGWRAPGRRLSSSGCCSLIGSAGSPQTRPWLSSPARPCLPCLPLSGMSPLPCPALRCVLATLQLRQDSPQVGVQRLLVPSGLTNIALPF